MKPETIKIGLHTFEIHFVVTDLMIDECGRLDLDQLQIYIRDGMPETMEKETLMHEILHAVRKLTATELPDEVEEEKVVQVMSHMLCEVFQDNKDFLKSKHKFHGSAQG